MCVILRIHIRVRSTRRRTGRNPVDPDTIISLILFFALLLRPVRQYISATYYTRSPGQLHIERRINSKSRTTIDGKLVAP